MGILMRHDVLIKWPDNRRENRGINLVCYGDPKGYSAMAKTVGFPCAIATRMIPPRANDDKKRVIEGMQPNVFRKILDYLFKGKVPLSSIDDAWKVKVAGRTFQLKELEELTTKF